MRVEIDAPRCIAAGQCVMHAPDVFDQDDDGIVVLLDATPPESLHEAVREAAALCPAALIRILEIKASAEE